MNYYGNDGMGWYDFARRMGFTGTPEQLMAIMTGNIAKLLDHTALSGRDEDDQHPISAIIGLQKELNRLADGNTETASVSGWKTVVLAPVQIGQQKYTEFDATAAEHVDYYAMPDEIDLTDGVYEAELIVLGLSSPTEITDASELLRIGFCDRSLGMESTYDYIEPFSVSATVGQDANDDWHRVSYHAVIDHRNYNVTRDGYVLGETVHDQRAYVINADTDLQYANTVTMRVLYKNVLLRTDGMILRYRKLI